MSRTLHIRHNAFLSYLENARTGITSEEIAEEFGMSRATVNRYLKYLRDQGIIKTSTARKCTEKWFVRRTISLVDPGETAQ